MDLNVTIDETKIITVRGHCYPMTVAGQGMPCLVIGNGLIVQRSLSQRFKQEFKVYASDLYWDSRYGLKKPYTLTIDDMMDDVVAMIENLNLEKPIIFGFSAFGLVALEVVKRYPHIARAVIIVGTPVNSNPQVAAINQEIFDQEADPHRKQVDEERRRLVSAEKLSGISFHERFKREYIFRDAPRYWHDPEFDCSPLWEETELDAVLGHFFESIMPFVDAQKNLDQIQIPVYLAAGLSDFDCCPVQGWGALQNLPARFKMEVFSQSGHYPQYEERELFDARLIKWLHSL